MRWTIYYGDGSTYDGESDEDAYNAPTMNVQVMKNEVPDNPRGYSSRHGSTFFCWERIVLSDGTVLDESRWGGKGDIFGLSHYYSTHPGPQKVLIGIEIYDQTYQDISKQVIKDGCFCTSACKHIGN